MSVVALTHILALCVGGMLGTAVGAFLLTLVQANGRDDESDDYLEYRRDAYDRDRVVPLRGRDRSPTL